MAGITKTGFNRKRLPEVLEDLRQAIKAAFGPDANVSDSGVFGRLSGVLAVPIAELWEVAEQVYNSFSPATACGIALDHVCALNGVARLPATPTTGWVILRLEPGTSVPAGVRFGIPNSPSIWFHATHAVSAPEPSACSGAWVTIPEYAPGTYRVTLEGVDLTATGTSAGNARTILTIIAHKINNGVLGEKFQATVLDDEDTLRIFPKSSGEIPLPFSVSVGIVEGEGKIEITHVGATCGIICSEPGRNLASAGSITEVLDPVPGLVGVRNIVDAIAGREIESDSELRLRREKAIHHSTGGTVEAIRSALLKLPEVNEALVLENTSYLPDVVNGLLPHSVKCFVDVPDDPEGKNTLSVCEAIWAAKPVGIATCGTSCAEVKDSQGFPHMVCFQRPNAVRIFVHVRYHRYAEEEFPEGGEEAIRAAVVDYARANQPIGRDVIPTRYVGPIHSAVSGIDSLEIKVKRQGGEWTGDPIPIAWSERAVISSEDVTVEEAP